MNETFTLITGTLFMVIMTFVVVVFAYLIQKKLIRKERAYREIELLLQKQELKSAYSLIDVQEQERKRIASEVHDNIGSLLATLKIYSDLVIEREQDSEIKHLNRKINGIIETVIEEIRKIAHSLDSDALRNFGLPAALKQLCEAISNSGKLEVKSFIDLHYPMEGEISLHLYRIIQELFTNTLKHAQAMKIRFEITQVNGDISIIHQDDGHGFDPQAPAGMGLTNIRSRIQRFNGEMKVQSSTSGTTFIIEIPLNNEHN